MTPVRVVSPLRPVTALLLAVWLVGCASMAPAPMPPPGGALPPALGRVAVTFSPQPPNIRIEGLGKGDAALSGAAAGALLPMQGTCGDPMSCLFVVLMIPVFAGTGAVVGAIKGESGAEEAATRVQAAVGELELGPRLAQRTAEQLVSDGIPATLLVVPPQDDRVPAGHDALLTLVVDQVTSLDMHLESRRALAISINALTRLASAPDNPRRSRHRVVTERHTMGEWLADGGRPLTAALDGAITDLAESVVNEVAGTAWVESLARLRDAHPDSGSVVGGLFTGLRPIYPGVSWLSVSGGLPSDLFAWNTVDTLQPTLRWEAFPEAADAVTYELRIAASNEDGDGPGKTVYRRTGLLANEHRIAEPLSPATKYFWSVRARFTREGRSFTTTWGTRGAADTGAALTAGSYRFRTPSAPP